MTIDHTALREALNASIDAGEAYEADPSIKNYGLSERADMWLAEKFPPATIITLLDERATLLGRIAALEEGLTGAIDDLLDFAGARWSEYEGSQDDLVGEYRALLKGPTQ